jgi:periplasmic protein TonB
MSNLRASSWIISLTLHGALALSLIEFSSGSAAFDQGTGADALLVEHGVPIESVVVLNDAADVVETAAVEPSQASEASPPPATPVALPEPPSAKPEESSEQASWLKAQPQRTEEREAARPQAQPRAQPEIAAVSEQHRAPAAQNGGDSDLFSAYLRQLREALERAKVNPNTEQAGRVLLRVSVDPSGKVLARDIIEGSGSKALDEAALASLDRASPLPALPAGMGEAPFEFSVPFKFSVH